ncbi:MAG: DUF7002 family protein [Nitrospiraceae bacterium]
MKLPQRIYHLAEAANLPSIRRHGLLSTAVLLDRAGLRGEQRNRFECCRRLEHTELSNGVYVRDQKPLPEEALRKCLVGMTPSQWYALINSRVFFWFDVDRLNRQRDACKPRPQVVLEVDTMRLVARHAARIALSRINTGNARRRPATRGRSTFVPYRLWAESGWASEGEGLGIPAKRPNLPPVELTIAEGVTDIMRFVVGVYHLGPTERLSHEMASWKVSTS